jgi:hypothetical protein
MAVAYMRGSTTGPNDLSITVRDQNNTLIDPYRLEYAVYDLTTGVEVLIGSPVNLPVKISTGQYYASVVIPADGNIGDWLIRWTIQEYASDPVYQSAQPFNVIGNNAIASFTGNSNMDGLIYSLRIMLRDNNPDRNYRFRPPATEKFIQGQTQVFGFLWEDEELLEYIYMAINDFNTVPPVTGIDISNLWSSEVRWKGTVLLRASWYALRAVALNWIVDEFDYSISGVSLTLEKSSKYQSMMDTTGAEYDKMTEAAKKSIKIVKGLRQFRYGVGITSALGPLNRPGVQSRRNMLDSSIGPGYL